MTQKLVGLVLLASIGCMDMGGSPQEPDPPATPDAAPPQPDAPPPSPPDAAAPVQTACVTSASQANERWYGCSTLDMFLGCQMEIVYNQQTDDGTRCNDCHAGGAGESGGAGSVLLNANEEAVWMGTRIVPNFWKLATPVSSGSGYEGLARNDIWFRKGIINNDGHPNYDFDGERTAAIDCYVETMLTTFLDCNNPCLNP